MFYALLKRLVQAHGLPDWTFFLPYNTSCYSTVFFAQTSRVTCKAFLFSKLVYLCLHKKKRLKRKGQSKFYAICLFLLEVLLEIELPYNDLPAQHIT